MGWNQGYTVLEAQIMGLHNGGVLTATVLRALLNPFEGTDIDRGGCRGLKTKDGKTADDLIIELLAPPEVQAELAKLAAVVPDSEWLESRFDTHGAEDASVIAGQEAQWAHGDAYYEALRAACGW